ncbi:exonuclease SbcC [Alteromonas macleodii]|uniref:exonuclease SbcC n=1 Tax=Alteromonas macleodii TaxID=28108 RepID=UPI00027E676E|nr:exonuclease SbcC [Alteromonas macleodii]AFS39366.1 exonuclease SbcC [Alteromonas macleodii ATCC 27126]
MHAIPIRIDHYPLSEMIGVISHIEAMKERIPTQLKVIKRNGVGLSALEKPYAVG